MDDHSDTPLEMAQLNAETTLETFVMILEHRIELDAACRRLSCGRELHGDRQLLEAIWEASATFEMTA